MDRGVIKGEGGFTLIEVVMAIVIFAVISVAIGSLLYQGSRSFEAMDIRRELTEQGSLATERLTRELRLIRCVSASGSCAPSASDITAMTSTEIRFVNMNNEGKGFRLDANALKLRRGKDATDPEDVLAANVSSLSFEYFKNDGSAAVQASEVWRVKASFTLTSGAESIDFTASVHPRHFL